MKILFLDHFGVMCLADKHGQEHSKMDLPKFHEMRIHGDFDNFDKESVIILNSIINTGVEIVVSSDWKLWCNFERMGDFYLSQGIIKKPIDYTPHIKNISDFKIQRSFEITEWLKNHNEVTNWVAIDDMFLPNLERFVWVSRTDEGIKQIGIKDNILNLFNDTN